MHSADTVFRYVVIHVYFIVIIDRLACSELCCIRNAMMNSVELFSINVGLYKGQLLTTSEEKWHREYYTGAVLCIETTTRYRSIDSDNPFFNVSKKHMLLIIRAPSPGSLRPQRHWKTAESMRRSDLVGVYHKFPSSPVHSTPDLGLQLHVWPYP